MTREREGERVAEDQARRRGLKELRRGLLPGRARRQPDPPAAQVDQAAAEGIGSVRPQLVSLFEPAQPDPPPPVASPAVGGPPQPVPPPQTPRRPLRAWLLVAPAVTLVVGAALGFGLGSAWADRQPATAAPSPSLTTQPAPAASRKVVVRPYASSACLDTARRGDHIIELLIRNRRRQASDMLVAYTVAARQCRQDASPPP
jgi:hypothetical protein